MFGRDRPTKACGQGRCLLGNGKGEECCVVTANVMVTMKVSWKEEKGEGEVSLGNRSRTSDGKMAASHVPALERGLYA